MASYDATIKIMLLGDESAEKTSLITRYISGFFDDSLKNTMGIDFCYKTLNLDDKKIKLQIWDFDGEVRFRFLLHQYCKGANAAFFLYDITNRSTLEHLPDWIQIIREHAGDTPIILVGAKAHLKELRAVSKDEGILAAKKYNLPGFIEVSSKTGQNVEKAFEALIRLVLIQPVFCHKCQKEFTFEEFLNHPCYKTGEVLSTGVINVRWIIARELEQRFLKQAKSEKNIGTIASFDFSLLKLLPFRFSLENSEIIAAALIQGNKNIVYSTDKWDISDELIKFLSDWNSIKTKSIKISGLKFVILHSSPKRFVTTPNNGETYIVGTKDGRETLLLYLKPKGNVVFDPVRLELVIKKGKELDAVGHEIKKDFKSTREDNDDDRFPYPYVFKPPSPPDDLALAARAQLRQPPEKKDREEQICCQYCGMELIKEEQLTHSCKEKP